MYTDGRPMLSGFNIFVTAGFAQAQDDSLLSPAQVICKQDDLATFCKLLDVAKADMDVAMLFARDAAVTVFAPQDRVRNIKRYKLSAKTTRSLRFWPKTKT